ncbi:hypothetical protein D5S18_05670 [Nocardia panacis]|uniref:Uncharacterized protein n=1 Tax=Nocardia panacis TaxID=2340916 RepID=A0A3A4KXF0_9NOCA|nr:hypothetical protein [Nocardia panacis]RJO78389.1 hypothetical protein D5S18_05670 [Nocardia panacis]
MRVAIVALSVLALTGFGSTMAQAATCSALVAETRNDLSNAGAPTSHTRWQDVRDDAQRFVDSHQWNGSATRKLQSDIQNLDSTCAA